MLCCVVLVGRLHTSGPVTSHRRRRIEGEGRGGEGGLADHSVDTTGTYPLKSALLDSVSLYVPLCVCVCVCHLQIYC